MPRLRETLDEIPAAVGTATRFPTERNKHAVRCDACDRLFYVDDATCDCIESSLEIDPTDNPFRCNDCEEEYDEEAVY